MKITSIISLVFVAVLLTGCQGNRFESPNHLLRADVDGQTINVYYRDSLILPNIHVGLIAETQNLDSALVLKSRSSQTLVNEEYEMPAGKRLHCTNQATEQTFTYNSPAGDELAVKVRLYNDGVAIRYVTPEGVKIVRDCTSYGIAEGVNRWIASYDYGYEQPYPYASDGSVGRNRYMQENKGEWGYPALIEPKAGMFALLAEADLRGGDCAAYLSNAQDRERYEVTLVGPTAFAGGESPWRCAIVGSLADIVESTLITDLASPSQIADASWIKPGVSSWIYWAYNHGSKDFALCRQYIDLAAEMGWPYCLVDWEWPEMTNGGDINDVMAYAREKGIGINLWYNSGTSWVGESAPQPQDRLNTAESRERELQWLEELGVSGIKVDFFNPANEEMVNYYIDILRDAARHHLLVDFHGCTIPNGWQRTWPNMMSMEAIYGAEWYNNGPFFTPAAAAHNATVPFTRNVIGPMDYTPGSFTDSQFPHITTNAHELALPVLFESGLQHMADRPAGYDSIPAEAKEALKLLPAIWDDTKLLSGYPGQQVVMARRSGNTWFVAGINGSDQPADLTFSLERLELTNFTSTLFCDGDADRTIDVKQLEVSDNIATVPCRARGGFMAIVH